MTLCCLCCCWLLAGLWVRDAWFWLTSKGVRRRRGKQAPYSPVKRFRAARPPRSGGRPKPPWAVEEVLRLYTEGNKGSEASKSYRVVKDEFNRLYAHQAMTVCLTTVHAWVRKYYSEMAAIGRETRNRFPAYAPANLRWGLDGTGKVDALGVQHFILGIIDHGTRVNLAMVRMPQETALAILEEVSLAVKKFGKPRFVRTDNAAVFHSAAFEAGLAAIGIGHEFTDKGSPWQNGRAERLFLTLKEKLNKIVPENGAALDSLLAEFSAWYNAVRPHQHLHGFTPLEVWRGINPYRTAPKEVLRFEGWDGMLAGFYLRR